MHGRKSDTPAYQTCKDAWSQVRHACLPDQQERVVSGQTRLPTRPARMRGRRSDTPAYQTSKGDHSPPMTHISPLLTQSSV